MSLRSNMASMAVSQAGLFVLGFISTVLVSRLLGPYEMGIFAAAMSVVGMLNLIRAVGLGGYLVRTPELTPAVVRTVFTVNAVLLGVVSLLTVGLSLLGGALLGEPGVRKLLLLLAILPLLNIADMVPAAGLERRGQFRAIATTNLLRFSLSTAATLFFAFNGYGYMSLGYGHVLGAVFGTALNVWFGRALLCFRPGLQQWREVTGFGLQMLSLSAINGAQGRIGDLVMARVLGLAALGFFSRANSLPGVLWEHVQVVIVRVYLVEFAQRARAGQSLRQSYLQMVNLTTSLLWPGFLGMAVVAGPLIETLYGDVWLPAAGPLSWLCLSSALFMLTMANGDIFMVRGKLQVQTRMEGVRVPLMLVAFGACCTISLRAAVMFKVVEAVIMVVVYGRQIHPLTDTRWADYVPILSRNLALAVVAVLPAAGLMTAYGWSAHAPIAEVLLSCAAGVGLWLVALWATDHLIFAEIRSVASRLPLLRGFASVRKV